MSSNIMNFKNIINQNFAAAKRKIKNIENNYNSSTSPTTSNNQDINRNVGEIITSNLPLTDAGLHLLDGSLIQGDGIYNEFVDYIADMYKNSRVYNPSAFTIIGSTSITADGVASGFSSSNVLYTNQVFNFSQYDNWEITIPYNTGDFTTIQTIFWTRPNSGPLDMNTNQAYLMTDGKIQWNLYSIPDSAANNRLFSWFSPSIISKNTDYIFKFKFTGSDYQFGYSSDGGKNYTWLTAYTGTAKCGATGYLQFGAKYTVNPTIVGSIDLKQSAFTADGVVFSGSASANYFTDEADWQQSVTQYGICGKFVYDSVNNTVRLPKYSNKIYTQDIRSSAPVVGNGIALGLTNGADNVGLGQSGYSGVDYSKFYGVANHYGHTISTTGAFSDSSGAPGIYGLTTDPTKSGIITDLSNITASLDGYYYIVIANSTKTDIQVDIDEVVTDLNGKADVDLSNVAASKGILIESYVNGASWYRVYSDGWCEQGGRCESSGASYGQTALLKPYKDINYTVLFSFNTNLGCRDDMFSVSYVQAYNKTASSFYSYRADSNSNLATMWRACGYV